MQGGLLQLGININGCEDGIVYLLSAGYGCFDAINIPGLSLEPIMPAEVCCATCENISGGDDIYGCTNELACNFDSSATIDDGSCNFCTIGCTDENACNYDPNMMINMTIELVIELGLDESLMCNYGVQCVVSPCSVSEDPGIDGAYCVDDYCENCCALWYFQDGTLIYNSCDNSNDNPAIGIWDDFENDQYIEITDDVIGFYSFLDDDFFDMCWYYWSMEYTYIGNGIMEVLDPEYGSVNISSSILENGDLQIIDPEGETILMSPLNELPEFEMCDNPMNEGCEDFSGQWVYLFPGTDMEVIWMEIDESGADFFILGDDLCVDYIDLVYDSIEGSDECTLFVDVEGFGFEFGQLSLNADGTLSFTDMPGFPEDWPEVWSPGNFDPETFTFCAYGCTDPTACNYDPFANADDGTCGLIDDCGDCQIPYCYDMITNEVDYTSEEECDNIWVGNDCELNYYCLSSPMNPYWNSGCVSMYENMISNQLKVVTNLMGQRVNYNNQSGLKIYHYNDGSVHKKYIIK